MPIELISTIVPKNNQDFATHEAQYGKGGWHTADNAFALQMIPAKRRVAGMAVRVVGEGKTYVLNEDLVTWELFVGGDGVQEAPLDGKGYVRKDGAWIVIEDFLDDGIYA